MEYSNNNFYHLFIIIAGLVDLQGSKTISKIVENIITVKSKSCIYKFLSRSQQNHSLLNQNISNLYEVLEYN
ncbi:hypothetical protein NVT68_001155 [Clostridium botulinum]|uniref:hypothetical protein n=1 Tax=Clostridium TaxID=1485 RepID=UPI0005F8F394|nr:MULTISPECIES: hypothetical protein [Clostridium]MDI6918233.1 hypothetical protein [Clostridium botulinum]WMU98367.1 hypothetical protein QA656_03605 [Clostridium botulinum]